MNELSFHPDAPEKVREFVTKLTKLAEELQQETAELKPEPGTPSYFALTLTVSYLGPPEEGGPPEEDGLTVGVTRVVSGSASLAVHAINDLWRKYVKKGGEG